MSKFDELKKAAEAAIEREDCDRFIQRDDALSVLELLAIQAQLVEALKDITGDISERFDMESSSTNPGIKNCVENARVALAAAGEKS